MRLVYERMGRKRKSEAMDTSTPTSISTSNFTNSPKLEEVTPMKDDPKLVMVVFEEVPVVGNVVPTSSLKDYTGEACVDNAKCTTHHKDKPLAEAVLAVGADVQCPITKIDGTGQDDRFSLEEAVPMVVEVGGGGDHSLAKEHSKLEACRDASCTQKHDNLVVEAAMVVVAEAVAGDNQTHGKKDGVAEALEFAKTTPRVDSMVVDREILAVEVVVGGSQCPVEKDGVVEVHIDAETSLEGDLMMVEIPVDEVVGNIHCPDAKDGVVDTCELAKPTPPKEDSMSVCEEISVGDTVIGDNQSPTEKDVADAVVARDAENCLMDDSLMVVKEIPVVEDMTGDTSIALEEDGGVEAGGDPNGSLEQDELLVEAISVVEAVGEDTQAPTKDSDLEGGGHGSTSLVQDQLVTEGVLIVEAVGADAQDTLDKDATVEAYGNAQNTQMEDKLLVEAVDDDTQCLSNQASTAEADGDIHVTHREYIPAAEVYGDAESYPSKALHVEVLEETQTSPGTDSLILVFEDTLTPMGKDFRLVKYGGSFSDIGDVDMVDGTPVDDPEDRRDSAVRGGLERSALRCHEHTLKLEEWKLTSKQKELVWKAGFGHFIKIGNFTLDKQQITALVERWNKETNTFHLPIGEMTITLDEVALNVGLAIDGDPVVAASTKDLSVVQLCQKYLGKTPTTSDKKGGFLKLGWLKDSFSECPEDAPLEKVEQYTRAYLLYLVGSTIFSTTTGNTVPVLYLPLFEDFDKGGRYAWGAAALAFLYRSLSNASSRAQNTISGCLTLLQCWSYLHLDIRRPRLTEKASHDLFPLALRWKHRQNGHRIKWSVLQYQKALDSLQPYDVEWLPYKYIDSGVPEDIKRSLILGKSKTTLLCFDKAEKHNPDRCMRQFGLPQPIPEDVQVPKRVEGEVCQPERKVLSHDEWMDRRERIVEGDSGVDNGEYAGWYSKFSRNVKRKTSLEDVYQQTVIGLTKMMELAQTLSREDMPTKNKEVVKNIKNALSEGLKRVIACKGKATKRQLQMLADIV